MSLTLFLLLLAGSFDLYGQASADLIAGGYQGKLAGCAGIEYRPGLELNKTIRTGRFNLVASLRAGFSINLLDDGVKKKLLIDPYRLFLGYGAERYEIRAGLQQINFGSAVLLRPLRWFDRVDPRDPLQTTEGVYGLLARGYSGNNSLWLWGLIGNREPKGYEVTSTLQWKAEAGGRVEVTLLRGELAASYHHRLTEATLPAGYDTTAENRIGLDGRWDFGFGLWFEGVVIRLGNNWQKQAVTGMDYTFGVGNGLTLLTEQLILQVNNRCGYLSALSLNYPLNNSENLYQLLLLDWQKHQRYIYTAWQKKNDRWLFTAAGFWGASSGFSYESEKMDRGLSLRLVFNH